MEGVCLPVAEGVSVIKIPNYLLIKTIVFFKFGIQRLRKKKSICFPFANDTTRN